MFVGDQRSLCPANTEMQGTLGKLHHCSLFIVLHVSAIYCFFFFIGRINRKMLVPLYFFSYTDIAPDDILYLIYTYLSTRLLLSVFPLEVRSMGQHHHIAQLQEVPFIYNTKWMVVPKLCNRTALHGGRNFLFFSIVSQVPRVVPGT